MELYLSNEDKRHILDNISSNCDEIFSVFALEKYEHNIHKLVPLIPDIVNIITDYLCNSTHLQINTISVKNVSHKIDVYDHENKFNFTVKKTLTDDNRHSVQIKLNFIVRSICVYACTARIISGEKQTIYELKSRLSSKNISTIMIGAYDIIVNNMFNRYMRKQKGIYEFIDNGLQDSSVCNNTRKYYTIISHKPQYCIALFSIRNHEQFEKIIRIAKLFYDLLKN